MEKEYRWTVFSLGENYQSIENKIQEGIYILIKSLIIFLINKNYTLHKILYQQLFSSKKPIFIVSQLKKLHIKIFYNSLYIHQFPIS